MADRGAWLGYVITLPLASVSKAAEWCRMQLDMLGIKGFVFLCLLLLLGTCKCIEDSSLAFLTVVIGLLIGLFPLLSVMIHFALMQILYVAYKATRIFVIANNACQRRMKEHEEGQGEYEEWERSDKGAWSRSQNQQDRSGNQDRGQDESAYGEEAGSANQNRQLALALTLYGMENKYTLDQLRHRRRDLMKKNHPDEGGTTDLAQEINMAYDILARHAAAG